MTSNNPTPASCHTLREPGVGGHVFSLSRSPQLIFCAVLLIAMTILVTAAWVQIWHLRLELELLRTDQPTRDERARLLARSVEMEVLKRRVAVLEHENAPAFRAEVVERINEIIEQVNAQKEILEAQPSQFSF